MIDTKKLHGFPRVEQRLPLAEFAQYLRENGVTEESAAAVEEVLAGDYVNVWLNHDDAFHDRWLSYNQAVEQGMELVKRLRAGEDVTVELSSHTEQTEQLALELNAALWSCSVEEARAIKVVSAELYKWLGTRAWELVREYGAQRKKGVTR